MDWPALERHFVRSTKQNRPAVDNAVEWDYSRYSRALGMTALPGLHQLPASSCALITGGTDTWDRVHERYRDWAGERGYRTVRVSAYPSMIVPDPVIAGIAEQIAGPDSLILARSGQQGEPALGKRPRSPGCSLAISPGERWLIAADRVRRRLRQETAIQGVIVQIDDAEKLTGNSLEMISYMVRAHTAWKDRMLSQDAKIYFVLATTPRHEDLLLRTLRRFQVCDLIIDRAPEPNPQDALSVEGEHVLEALVLCPVALRPKDCRELFGQSVARTLLSLLSSAYLRERTELGQSAYIPRPDARRSNHERVASAVSRLLASLCRRRPRLRWVLAEIWRRRGIPRRFRAALRAVPPSIELTMPIDVEEQLDGTMEDGTDPRVIVFRLAFAAACRKDHEACRQANLLLTCSYAREDTYAVVKRLVVLGASRAEDVLPEGFWPGFAAGVHQDRTAADTMAVLGELFHRGRLFALEQFAARTEFTLDLIADLPVRYRAVADQLAQRAVYSLAVFSGEAPVTQEIRRSSGGGIIAIVHGASLHSRGLLMVAQPGSEAHTRARWTARHYCASTGVPEDAIRVIAAQTLDVALSGLRLWARSMFDEMCLCARLPRHASLVFQYLAPTLGTWARDIWRLLPQRANLGGGYDPIRRVEVLRAAGAYVRAEASLDSEMAPMLPLYALRIEHARAAVSFEGLRWEQVDRVGPGEAVLPPRLRRFLRLFREGCHALLSLKFRAALTSFRQARESVQIARRSAAGPIVRNCTLLERVSLTIQQELARPIDDGQKLTRIVVRLIRVGRPLLAPAPRSRLNPICHFLIIGIEAWAANRPCRRGNRPVLDVARFLHEHMDPAALGDWRSVAEILELRAPHFFEILTEAVSSGVEPEASALDKKIAVELAIGVFLPHVDTQEALAGFRKAVACTTAGPWKLHLSPRTKSVARDRVWPGDATEYMVAGSRLRQDARVDMRAYWYETGGAATPHVCSYDLEPSRHKGKAVVSLARRVIASEPLRRPASFGTGDAAVRIDAAVRAAAKSDYPVVISGATGVGKEFVCRAVHRASGRQRGGIVVVPCGAMTETLLEAELFGWMKGAFTGAVVDSQGLFEVADGGTMLLDGLEEMSPRLQALMLRVVETGEFRRVGEASVRKVNVRFIATVGEHPDELVTDGAIREDLYFRLNVLRIDVPPLRERREDIGHFARLFARDIGVTLSRDALRQLAEHDWPGNLHELRNVVRSAWACSSSRHVGTAHLAQLLSRRDGRTVGAKAVWARLASHVSDARFSSREFAALAQVGGRTAQRYLAELVRAGFLCRIGAGRATMYHAP